MKHSKSTDSPTLEYVPEVKGTTLNQCIEKLLRYNNFIKYSEAKNFAYLNREKVHSRGTATVSLVIHESEQKVLILHPNPHNGRKLDEHIFPLNTDDVSHDQRQYFYLKPV